MMNSKFWAVDASSSDSDSSDAEQVEDTSQAAPKAATRPAAAANRWANVESSSDEEARRVVKSAKDKQWEQLREIIRKMENHKKIFDYGGLADDYEALQRALNKAKSLIDAEGMPKFFVRALVDVEDFVSERLKDREAFKKLTKLKATALNTLRAKIRKGNEPLQETLETCRDNPSQFQSSSDGDSLGTSSDDDDDDEEEESSGSEDDESSSEDDSGSDSSGEESNAMPTASKKPTADGILASEGMQDTDEADDESDSYWGDSSDESSSASEVEEREFEDKHQMALHKWGIKATHKDKPKGKQAPKDRKPQTATAQARKKEKDSAAAGVAAAGAAAAQGGSSALLAALFERGDQHVDAELLTRTVGEVMAQRGKKATDRTELIKALQQLVDTAASIGPQSIMEMLGHLISGYFDTNLGAFTCLSSAYWLEAYKHVDQVLSILSRHPTATFHAATITGEALAASGPESASSAEERTASMVTAFLDRLDDELTKALQFADVHSEDYKERLRQSIDLLALLWRAHIHFLNRSFPRLASGVALRILEHVYYKPEALSNRMWDMVRKGMSEEDQSTLPPTSSRGSTEQLDLLVDLVLTSSDSARSRVRAVLHKSYNRALAGVYHDAKDLLHTCNLQELATQSDVSTQILYNRCLTQLGLCAFRLGLITEAHSCLSEICTMNRHRELLAQGVSMMKNHEKTLEQEREEKRRQLPYHMHISLDLIEGVHNLSAMLLEVPNMAAHPFNHGSQAISKQFRRMLDMHDRQMFVGPPENPRETIIAATRALQKGDAHECSRHVFNLKIWDQMPNRDEVKETIRAKVKAEALRTYIFTFSSLYHSFSVSQLTAMFELPRSVVHSIVSKMMVKEELLASWDESSECIVINRVEPTPLQVMALQLAERVVQAVDQNELLLNFKNPRFVMQSEPRGGRRFQDDSRWDRDRGGGQRWQGRGDYRDYGRTAGVARGPQPIQRGSRGGGFGVSRGRGALSGGVSYAGAGASHRSTWQATSQNISARA